MEELVAELSAAMLGADLGLPVAHLDHHASYLASWLKVLKADSRAILTVAAKAEQAASLLLQLGRAEASSPSGVGEAEDVLLAAYLPGRSAGVGRVGVRQSALPVAGCGAGEALLRPAWPPQPASPPPVLARWAGLPAPAAASGFPAAARRCGAPASCRRFGLPSPDSPAARDGRHIMHTTLAAQLAQLELGHLRVERIGSAAGSELPDAEAVAQTLAAIWSTCLRFFRKPRSRTMPRSWPGAS
jgi:hypothetical protein